MPVSKTPKRCPWADVYTGAAAPDYLRYHDEEWGVPCHDEHKLFEMLILEGAQAGLSWATILARRENYRRALDGFDAEKIARYDERKMAALMNDAGIIRNRLKLRATRSNAQAVLKLRETGGGLDAFLWRYVAGKPLQNHWRKLADVPASTELSQRISRDLKRAGLSFVGPTSIYAYMQSIGLVNDHLVSCPRHAACAGMG